MTPQELAACCERGQALAAEWPWRHPAASAFADWLAAHWDAACPAAPAGPPAATSALGREAIRWFAVGEALLGYAAGGPCGCYRVPAGGDPPVALPP